VLGASMGRHCIAVCTKRHSTPAAFTVRIHVCLRCSQQPEERRCVVSCAAPLCVACKALNHATGTLLARVLLYMTHSSSDVDLQQGWRLFDWDAYNEPWDVPWGGGTIAGVMASWTVAFGLTAFVVTPLSWTAVSGTPLWELTSAGQAQFALFSETVEAAVTAALLFGLAYK